MIQWPLRGPEFEKKEERKPKPAFFQRTNFNYQKKCVENNGNVVIVVFVDDDDDR